MNDDGSILLSTALTELIENQLIMRILKSVLIVSAMGMFSLMEGNVLCLKTAVFRKTDTEYPVTAHPALVLKRDSERETRNCMMIDCVS